MGYKNPELSVVFTDDASIQELNLTWRGKDKPTDVLSFSQIEGEAPPAGTKNAVLGDIIVSTDTAQRQADAFRHSLDEELQRLLVHGVLHLLGHDHVNGGWQARNMKLEEQRLMKVLHAENKTAAPKSVRRKAVRGMLSA